MGGKESLENLPLSFGTFSLTADFQAHSGLGLGAFT
jgi:hypothetical protein